MPNKIEEGALSNFKISLPMSEALFSELFDFLDIELGKKGCNHTVILTRQFLEERQILDSSKIVAWLANHGGCCDCEVLGNVEDLFDYLGYSDEEKSIHHTQIKKQKLSSLKTDFGFSINSIPSPWTLIETNTGNQTTDYTFQIGKGTKCVLSLEKSFPFEQFNNDKFWIDQWIKETELYTKVEDLMAERIELDNYYCILVKSKNWIPVLYWIRSKLTEKWALKMKTESSRHKGDFKEVNRLLNNINVE